MPRELNFMNETVIPIGKDTDIPWEKVSGREIYNLDSITSLNKTPVKVLGSFVQGGATVEGEPIPFTLPDLVENLLVDGTIAILTTETPTGTKNVFLKNIIVATETHVVQQLPRFTRDGKRVHRVYKLEGTRWVWTDVVNWGTDKETPIDQSTNGIAAENLRVYINGNGILYDAQFTYRRLEEIERKVRRSSNSAVTMIITGYVGFMEGLFNAIRPVEGDEGVISLPTGVDAEFPKTTAVVDQLHRDFALLLPLYFKTTNLMEVDDSTDLSGKALKILMQQTLEFITLTRKLVEDIYTNWGIQVQFESLPLLDATEKMAELTFLRELRDDKVITVTQYKHRAAKLL